MKKQFAESLMFLLIVLIPFILKGQPNNVLVLNGTSDFKETENSPILAAMQSFTIETWVKFNTNNSGDRDFIAEVGNGNRTKLWMWYNNVNSTSVPGKKLVLGFGGALGGDANNYDFLYDFNPTPNTWYHLAFLYNHVSRTLSLYINGVNQGNKSVSGGQPVSNLGDMHLTIGQRIGGNLTSHFFNGQIEDFRLWNVARSSAEISANYQRELSGKETGLIAYYKFDEADPSISSDCSTNFLDLFYGTSRPPVASTVSNLIDTPCGSSTNQERSLLGKWMGQADQPGAVWDFEMEVLSQNGNQIKGVNIVSSQSNRAVYGHIDFDASLNNDVLILKESKIRFRNGSVSWCIKSEDLKLLVSNGNLYLKGSWNAPGCNSGTIVLRKIRPDELKPDSLYAIYDKTSKEPILWDDFDNNNNNWPLSGTNFSAQIQNGILKMTNTGQGGSRKYYQFDSSKDYEFEIRCKIDDLYDYQFSPSFGSNDFRSWLFSGYDRYRVYWGPNGNLGGDFFDNTSLFKKLKHYDFHVLTIRKIGSKQSFFIDGLFVSDYPPNSLAPTAIDLFVEDGSYNQVTTEVDYVKLSYLNKNTFEKDLGVTQLLTPVSGCKLSNNNTVKVRIFNFGKEPQSNFNVSYQINNGIPVVQNIGNQVIQPGASLDFTFSTPANFSNTGTYAIKVATQLSNDQNAGNDQYVSSIENLPAFNGQWYGETQLCEKEYINVYATGGKTYSWSTGATTSFLYQPITTSTTYYVTITGAYPGCVDVDTIPIVVTPLPQTPVIQASNPDLVFCDGKNITLSANISSNLDWTTGAKTTSIRIDRSGTYGARQLGINGCHSPYTYVYVRELPLPELYTQGNSTVCSGSAETMQVFNATAFRWSTGATTSSITVRPSATTTYTVTVTNAAKCSYELSNTVYVAPNLTPGAPANLLPLDGAMAVGLPVQLSWSPGNDATLYDLYIWLSGNTEPTSPQYSNIRSINYTLYNLAHNKTYRWKVRSKNCNIGPFSATQTFTTISQADLSPQAIQIPIQAVFSGGNLSLRWEVRNRGMVSTPANAYWHDIVYLSKDNTLGADDFYIGYRINPSALAPGQVYTSSVDYTLPKNVEGEYFVIVATDGFNYLEETDENNNRVVSSAKVKITLTPPPDLKVTTIVPPGVAGNIFSGTSGTVEWTVKNQGTGTTRANSWEDRVYYTTDPSPINRNWRYLGSRYHEGALAVNATYTQSIPVNMPSNFNDTIYIVVETDVSDQEYEHLFEENNITYSTPIRVILTPQPDLTAKNIVAPAVVNNNQQIQIQWQGQNIGAKYDGYSYDEVYLSSSSTALINARYLGYFERQGLLNTDMSYSASVNITIPTNLNGNYFLVILTEAGRRVIEANENNNLLSHPISIQSPNLQALDVVGSTTAVAGQNINVDWRILNAGPGELLASNLIDDISLSLSSNGTNPISLGNLSGSVSLGLNARMNRQRSLALPLNLAPGTYYIVVKTNTSGTINEAGRISDNIAVAKQAIVVTAPSFPDLQAMSITVPTQVNAGAIFTIRYRVRNVGAANAVGRWLDYIYLSKNANFNAGGNTLIQTKQHTQVVPIGQEYTDSVQVQLSANLGVGTYYFHLWTDANNQILENTAENNNQISSSTLMLRVPPVVNTANLNLRNVIAPISVAPGETSTLRWSVLNSGTATTPVQVWEDRLYLSTDSILSPATDLLVAKWPYHVGLSPNASYNKTERFTLPSNATGRFFIILATDPDNLNQEPRTDDNYAIIRFGNGSTGGGPPVVIYPPSTDLEITAFLAPNAVIAGQPITLRYTIRNNGPGDAKPSWSDLFVLSQDLQIGNDSYLGQNARTLELKANHTYTDSIRVFVSAEAGGNYLILGKTDQGNNLTESNETNNLANTYLFVQRPLPADLTVGNITSSPKVRIGRELNVSWQLQNQGVNPISGYMRELVYLSLDTTWDAQDQLLGTLEGNIALLGKGVVTRRLSNRVENVSHAAYHLIVRTDVLNNLPEENENNNSAYSQAKVEVEIPELPIGKLVSDTLKASLPLYYRLESSPQLKNETLLITLNSSNDQAVNELYLRRGQVPNRTVFDFAFDQPFQADQQILVPLLKDSTYYLMAFPVQPARSNQLVTLLAEIVEFGLNSVNASKGGNTGNVTVKVKGTKLDADMKVWLEAPVLGKIEATNVQLVNTTEAFVTFNLNGAKLGKYDLKAANIFGDSARLVKAFEVVQGTVGASALQVTCTIGNTPGNPLVLNANDPITFEAIHPASARPNQVIPITLRFENTGNVDLPTPRRFLSSLNGAPLGLLSDQLQPDTQELNLEFSESNGPSNALRPGAVVTRTVYTQASLNLTVLQFNLN